MLLKIKQTRYSNRVSVFDKISQVVYSDALVKFYEKKDLPQETVDVYVMAHEYGVDAEKYGDMSFGKETNTAFQMNEISFTYNGERKTTFFDGDGYLCNDDGKTIHRFERGGVLHLGEQPTEEAA